MSDAEAIARVLEHSVVTFGGVVQTDFGPKAATEITSLRARVAELEAALKRIANDCGTNLASKDEMLAEIAFARMVARRALKVAAHDPR